MCHNATVSIIYNKYSVCAEGRFIIFIEFKLISLNVTLTLTFCSLVLVMYTMYTKCNYSDFFVRVV